VLSKSDQSVMVRCSSCVNSQRDICNHILPGRLSATNGWFFLERTKKYQSFVSYAFSHYQFGIFSSTSLHYRILSCYIYFTLHFVRCTLSRAVGSSLVIGAYKHCIFACFCNFDQQVNQGNERKQGMKREAGESRDWNKVLSFCHSANSLLTGHGFHSSDRERTLKVISVINFLIPPTFSTSVKRMTQHISFEFVRRIDFGSLRGKNF